MSSRAAQIEKEQQHSDVNLPGFRLHQLKGFWSVMVRANWRVIFRLHDGHVWDVE